MVITRWDPFRDIASLQNRMNSLFQDFSRSQQGENDLMSTANFVPPVDVYEDEHQVTLKVEVPGIRPEDIDIRVENNTLAVRGERKFEKEEKEENFQRVERRYGSFYRAFTLPSTVDADQVKAEYENGVLRIRLDKKAEAKPKQIKVDVTPASKQVEAPKQSQAGKQSEAA
jgi:HSP20 family protein